MFRTEYNHKITFNHYSNPSRACNYTTYDGKTLLIKPRWFTIKYIFFSDLSIADIINIYKYNRGISIDFFKQLLNLAPNFLCDINFLEIVMSNTLEAFIYMDFRYRDNETLARLTIYDPEVFKYVSSRLRDDEQFMTFALTKNPWLIDHACDAIQHNDKMVNLALSINNDIFSLLTDKYTLDHEFVLERCRKEFKVFQGRIFSTENHSLKSKTFSTENHFFKQELMSDFLFVYKLVKLVKEEFDLNKYNFVMVLGYKSIVVARLWRHKEYYGNKNWIDEEFADSETSGMTITRMNIIIDMYENDQIIKLSHKIKSYCDATIYFE